MKKGIIFIFLILFLSCGIFDTKEDQIIQKLYVCIQGENKVAVYNTPSLSLLKLIDVDFSAGVNIPHFVILDEINNYWFVTAMNGGYVARFDLLTDEFIDADNEYFNDVDATVLSVNCIYSTFVKLSVPSLVTESEGGECTTEMLPSVLVVIV